MRLRIFHSDKGDCVLLSSAGGKNVLVDGGMAGSYEENVAPELDRLRQRGEGLDLVYVSHIDQDHISGILRMLDDMVDWRVFRFHEAEGDDDFRRPRSVEPPAIGRIWHNAFHEQVGKNAGPIEDMLAANSARLSVLPEFDDIAEKSADLETSMAEAVKVSRRISDRQLGIPLNPEYGEGLMFVADPADPIVVDDLSISVIGPFDDDLKVLRRQWNRWLKSQKGKGQLRRIRDRARDDEDRLRTTEFDRFLAPLVSEASHLGDRDSVTPPNLASLMLLVEEGPRSVLLTGDGHWQDILDGLEACGRLDNGEGIHVDVLKVQHHGSEHNTHPDFCRAVTADHYVFCGNGAHHNPDLEVVQAYIDSRLGSGAARSDNPEVGNRFCMWFNDKQDRAGAKFPGHMREVERLVSRAASGSNGQMKSRFLKAVASS